MKRIGYIYEKIISVENCKRAILNAAQGKTRRKEVGEILDNLDYYAHDLSHRMEELNFLTPYKKRIISDGLSNKKRELQIPSFYPDQCAHHALIQILKPIIEKSSYYWSCANIPGRGIDKACKGVERATIRDLKHAKYCVKLDITKFYPSISHDKLKARFREKFKDERALALIDKVIDSHSPGLPIGNYTSPWFAEFLLQPLDMLIKQDHHIRHYVRYADDMVLIDNNKKKLRKAMYAIMDYLESKDLKPKGDYQLFRIQQDGKGRKIDFVGRCFGRGFTTVRKRRALAFMRQSRYIRKLERFGRPVPFKIAAGFLSRSSCLKHTDSFGLRKQYYDTVNIKKLKEVIRNESKRQLETRCA